MPDLSVAGDAPAPVDMRWIILKIHQRCNLNCSYCYVYNRGDDSWKSRPKQISDAVIDQVCRRIDEQAKLHGYDEFVVELHGGEPLLVGKARFVEIVERLRARCETPLTLLLQTNGTLLDAEWCRIFAAHGVSVGVSLDGPAEIADASRVFRNGRGSTGAVMARLAAIRDDPDAEFDFGVLSVVNPAISGAAMIDWYVEHGIDSADFLLPLGNVANLPDGWTGVAPYRDFLLSAFERWLELDGKAPSIRLFETIIRGHMGQKARLDALGGDLGGLCVVETNGAIGISDVIRLCGGTWAEDRISIADTAFADHVAALDVDWVQEPAAKCRACDQFAACGGGYVPHRHDGTSFANPSLYCEALYALSRRALAAILDAVPSSMVHYSEAA